MQRQQSREPYPRHLFLLALPGLISVEGNPVRHLLPPQVIKVLDLKCPDSGESGAMDWKNCDLVTSTDQIKFVVASFADFEWSRTICEKFRLLEKCSILFSPVAGKVKPVELAEWILTSEIPVTMQIQLHKEIWGPEKRGV